MSQIYNLSLQSGRTTQAWRRNQNTVKFQAPVKLGPVSHTVIVALMLAVLGLIYLTQITKTSTYGYQLNELGAKKEQLLSESRDLEVESARLQALERVQQSNVANNMTAPQETGFVTN